MINMNFPKPSDPDPITSYMLVLAFVLTLVVAWYVSRGPLFY